MPSVMILAEQPNMKIRPLTPPKIGFLSLTTVYSTCNKPLSNVLASVPKMPNWLSTPLINSLSLTAVYNQMPLVNVSASLPTMPN
jgi:hypothetical protein